MFNNLTQGKIFNSLVKFSLPFLFSSFLQLLYGLADLFIIGQFCTTEVTTAVSVGSQVMHMFTVIIIGLAMGTTVLISHSVGAKNQENAAKATGNSITMFLIISIIFCLILIFLVNPILKILSVPEESIEQTRIYLIICFTGIPFITMYNVISSIFRGLGDSKTPMYFVAAACAVNILADYFFIGQMGMKAGGAALGTVISQTLSVIFAVILIKVKGLGIKISKSDFKLSRIIVKKIFQTGFPIAAQDGFIQISFIVITIIANTRGNEIAAAVGIVEKIIGIMFLVPSSMLASISAFAAQNAGAELHQRAAKALFTGMAITTVWGIVFSILTQFCSVKMTGIFTSDKTVQIFGGQYLRSYVFDCILAGIHFCFSGYFSAYQKSILSFIHNIISVILVRIPLAYAAKVLYPENLFPMGMAAPIGSAVSAIICLIFFMVFFKNRILKKESC